MASERNYVVNNPYVRASHTKWTREAGDGSGQWGQNYGTLELGKSPNDLILQAGQIGNRRNAERPTPYYFGNISMPESDRKYIPDYNRTFGTPFGDVQLQTNEDNYNDIWADFYPNQRTDYYIQALANLLSRR